MFSAIIAWHDSFDQGLTLKKEIFDAPIVPICAIGAFGINESTFELYDA
jgi:hypothetical protein